MAGLANAAIKEPAVRMGKGERLARVVRLRDEAIKLVKEGGVNKQVGTIHVAEFKQSNLVIWYERWPHCFGLDIWDTAPTNKRKVFNVQWKDGDISIVSFHRGDWEQAILNADRQQFYSEPPINGGGKFK